jgi:hypothetical protein
MKKEKRKRNPYFKGFPLWYETAWLVFDTQSDEEFRQYWRSTTAPEIERCLNLKRGKKA